MAATALRPVLPRTAQPTRASRGLHADADRRAGDTTAGQLTWNLSDRSEPFRYVIRNRDQKFADRFDEVFRSAGCEIVRTSFRAPQANGVAERFVRTVRSECLDWLLILNEQQLRQVLAVFVAHYNDASCCLTSLCA